MEKSVIHNNIQRLNIAFGLNSSEEQTAMLIKEFKFLNEELFVKAIDRVLGLEQRPKNLIATIKYYASEQRISRPGTQPEHWWIRGDNCFRCGNIGLVPVLEYPIETRKGFENYGKEIMLGNQRIPQRAMLECDCIHSHKLWWEERDRYGKDKIVLFDKTYLQYFGDDHQFPFNEHHILKNYDYPFVFQTYEMDFRRRWKTDNNAKFYEKELEIKG